MNMNETLMQEMADKRAEIHQLKARNSELEKENVELKNRIANLAANQNPANNATKVDKELSRLGWSHSFMMLVKRQKVQLR